jgi:hypothetical protein
MRLGDFSEEDDSTDCNVALVDEGDVGVSPLRVKRSVYSTVLTGLNELFSSVEVSVGVDSELNLI